MSENPIKQVLSDLLPYFEALEAQSSAILRLLRDKQIVNDEELSRYLQQAGDSSSVKWRAARVRMEHLFAVSSEPTTVPKTETVEMKEVKQTNGRPDVEPKDSQANRPGTAVAPEVADGPNSSEESPVASEKAANDRPKDAKAEISASAESDLADLEKAASSKRAEKDAA